MAEIMSAEEQKQVVCEKMMAEIKEFKETLCFMPDYQAVEEFGGLCVRELFFRAFSQCDISEECIHYFYDLIQETEEPIGEVLWRWEHNDIDYLFNLCGKSMAQDIEDYSHRNTR